MIDRTGILKRSPLVYVLASVRFAPWPLMAKKIDEIHDDLREMLPLINRVHIQRVGPMGQFPQQREEETQSAVWMLMPSDRSYGIQFAPEQLLMCCKKYTRYADFEKILDRVFDVLLKHMRFVDVTNVGVRYVDHIKVRQEKDLEDYINHGLLPVDIEGLKKRGGIVTGSYTIGSTELRVRSVAQPESLSVPEDLVSIVAMIHDPNTPLRLETLKTREMLLDIDSVQNYASPKRMEKDGVLGSLKSLHKAANNFFRHESVCTENAFKDWKGGA